MSKSIATESTFYVDYCMCDKVCLLRKNILDKQTAAAIAKAYFETYKSKGKNGITVFTICGNRGAPMQRIYESFEL